MKLKEMIETYQKQGLGSEKKMWEIIYLIEDYIEDHNKEEDKQRNWDLIRDIHEIFVGAHFDEKFAKYEVEMMHHKDAKGTEYKGQHWSMEQTDGVYEGHKSKLSSVANKYDFYVALNAMYHDLCKGMKERHADWTQQQVEAEIIAIAVDFYFFDDDAPVGKLWHYMNAMREYK